MEFKETKFEITGDIALIVNLAYYNGHPIVETKKTKIDYKGTLMEINRKNSRNTALMNQLISTGLRSIFSIELVNYLNRLINGDNLYEVYTNNVNYEDSPDDLINYVFKPEKQCSSTRALNDNDIIDALINDEQCCRTTALSDNGVINALIDEGACCRTTARDIT